MADSNTNLSQVETSQAQKEVTINGLFDAASPAMIFGRRAEACGLLIWGYYGGRYGGAEIENGTLTLVANATNYMVVNRSTGEVSLAGGSPSGWVDTDNFARAYKIVTGPTTAISWEDHRAGVNGTQNGSGPGDGGFVGAIMASDVLLDDADGNFGSPATVESALKQLAESGTSGGGSGGSGGSGPAFSAYAVTATSVPAAVLTKVTLDAEEFDTDGCFASSRFTPDVAGYYQINWHVSFDSGSPAYVLATLYKNGSRFKDGSYAGQASVAGYSGGASIVYFNGSTDYVEMYAYVGGPSAQNTSVVDASRTWLNGCWIRG